MSKEVDKFERLLAALGRQARAQERAARIRPPTIRATRRGPTREEMRQAIALADAVLLAHGRNLSPMARGALQGAVARRAMRQPQGDFSQPQPYQPTADQQALLQQLYAGQRRRYLEQHPLGGDKTNWEPRTWQSWVAQALAPLEATELGSYIAAPLAKVLTKADMRAQLLDLSWVPSPPEAGRYPWTLLSSSELEDVKARLYAPGGPVTQRMATTGY
jgi:hypothetical protein